MAKIDNDKLQLVKKFYFFDSLSAREIANKLDVSLDAVYYFLRKNKIPRRNPSQCNQVRFAKKTASFKTKNNLTKEEKELKVAGITLYWGGRF